MGALTMPGLEQVYDDLAAAIDRAPEGKSELMLVKLALLLAQQVGDAAQVKQCVEAALQDL